MWSLNYREPAGAAEYIYRDKSGGQVFGDFNYQLHQYRTMSLSKAIVVSVLNQMVSSATNFLFGLYLVRNLPPVEFGLYGIGFAITLFYAGIGNAMFLTQMVVHIPNKAAEDREPYAARICLIMMLFCLVTAFCWLCWFMRGVLFRVATQISSSGHRNYRCFNYHPGQDFSIRHCYTLRKEIRALLGQYCSCALARRFLYCSVFGTSGWEFGILSPALWPQ